MPCSRSIGYRFHASPTLTHLHKWNPGSPFMQVAEMDAHLSAGYPITDLEIFMHSATPVIGHANPKDPKKCHGHLERGLGKFRYGQRSSISPASTIQKSRTCPLKQQNTRQRTLGYNSTTTAIQKGQEHQLNLLCRKYKSYYTEGIILAERPW